MTLLAVENLFRHGQPVDHYYRCDTPGCGAQERPVNQFQCPLPAGWLEAYEDGQVKHFCRKCAERRKACPPEGEACPPRREEN